MVSKRQGPVYIQIRQQLVAEYIRANAASVGFFCIFLALMLNLDERFVIDYEYAVLVLFVNTAPVIDFSYQTSSAYDRTSRTWALCCYISLLANETTAFIWKPDLLPANHPYVSIFQLCKIRLCNVMWLMEYTNILLKKWFVYDSQ